MNISILSDSIDTQYAGIHIYTKHLILGLAKSQYVSNLYTIRSINGPKMAPNEDKIIIENKKIPLYRYLRAFYIVPRFIKKINPDIVIEPAHFGPFNLPKTIKRVTVIHDLSPILNSSWHPLARVVAHRLLLKTILRKADLIITNSAHSKSDIVSYYPQCKQKIKAVHLGVSSSLVKVDSKQPLQKLGINKSYILYLGTIEPRKNLSRVIEAYNHMRRKHPERTEQLLIAGKEGWKTRDIMNTRRHSPYVDDIILLGYVDREDIPCLLSHTSLFVYPSLYEGFGLPVLEALACGARVLTSNTSSLPEVGGEHCDYCDPYDIGDIATKMSQALISQDTEEEQKARITYAQGYTWERFGETFSEYLQELHQSDR